MGLINRLRMQKGRQGATVSEQASGDEIDKKSSGKSSGIKPLTPARAGRSENGFTLIEMMVVTGIVAILAAIAFGSLQTQLPRARTKAAARALRSDLQKAKLEAVKRNTDCLVVFTVAAGNNSGSCVTCIDDNGDTLCNAADDTIITELDFGDYDDAALSNENFSGNPFVFNSRGIPKQTTGAMCAGTAVVNCTSDANYSRSVVMSSVGRIRID